MEKTVEGTPMSMSQDFASAGTGKLSEAKIVQYDATDITVITDDVATLSAAERTLDANGVAVGEWRTGLFDCFNFNLSHGILAAVLPCVPVGQIAHRVGLGQYIPVLVGAGLFYAASFGLSFLRTPVINIVGAVCALVFIVLVTVLRLRMRTLFEIPGSAIGDVCTVMWCGWCALAQMSAHVESIVPGSCSLGARDVLPGYK
ncbi:Aste57867_3363 [Aphanomyces stellatus]|uniref:Aste57867_3363 protein n=1 Tax=Aphanomyces stellatus TaxID=120398 RepID=A0A485KEZ8_9STRA|nr:hypothetical protein As57867_003353 [Aphanomyces stellatus]VFT80531.1 Aste57867_3363 [Aphanomyces stellatus]